MNFPWFISIYLSARPVSTNRFIDKYFCQYSPRYSPFSTSCKVFFNIYGIAIKYKFWNANLNCLEIEICFLFNRGIFELYKSFFPSKLGKFVGLKYDDYKYTYNISLHFMRHCANHSLSEYLNTNVSTLLEETLF